MRQKSRRDSCGGGSGSSSSVPTAVGNVLQDMVDQATDGLDAGSSSTSSTGLSQEMEGVRLEPLAAAADVKKGDPCPITDKEEKPFPLMMLPAEVRNEVYRACLTRPFHIVLSKREPVVTVERRVEPEVGTVEGGEEQNSNAGGGVGIAAAALSGGMYLRPVRLARPLHRSTTDRADSAAPTQGPAWATRSARAIRFRSVRATTSAAGDADTALPGANPITPRRARLCTTTTTDVPRKAHPQDADPLLVNLLRVNKTVYQEARSILYSENMFTLDLETALPTLACLHQRSRRQIKHVELEIPNYNEILERFQETVRLSLRYCWGLRTFVIHMPFTLPGADGSGTTGNTMVYANGFDILRWLPRQCEVRLRGKVCAEIEAVVSKNATLAKTLDEVCIARAFSIDTNFPCRSPLPPTLVHPIKSYTDLRPARIRPPPADLHRNRANAGSVRFVKRAKRNDDERRVDFPCMRRRLTRPLPAITAADVWRTG